MKIQTHGTGNENQIWVTSGKRKILLTFLPKSTRIFLDVNIKTSISKGNEIIEIL